MEVDSCVLYSFLEEDLSSDRSPAAESLRRSLFKKFEDDSGDHADRLAIEKFLSVNERLGTFRPREIMEWEWMVLGELKSSLHRFFHPSSVGHILDAASIFDAGMAGPGASIGARGEDFYTKHFDSTLTFSSNARFLPALYSRQIQSSSMWRSAEILRQSRYGFSEVQGSRLSTVPKNVDISRTTCTEPTLNMFYQLGIGGVISRRLRDWGVDLSVQPTLNRELARVGSLEGTFGTIDLQSASDSLSQKLLAWCLDADVFATLQSVRCEQTQTPSGEWVKLNMISTMGNGYTFPLQTVLFTCIVLSVYKVMDLPARKSCNGGSDTWGVFGDDIIVVRKAYDNVCRILELLGFVVNTEKSFNEGPFRESCGADYLAGTDIRGVYCKTLRTVGARFSLLNRLIMWSARHGIYLYRTVDYLLQSVPVTPVPFLAQEDSGLRVPSAYFPGVAPQAYVFWSPLAPKIRVERVEGGDDFVRLKHSKGLRRRNINHYGLVVAMVQGSFTRNTISLRASRQGRKYVRSRTTCGYWDSITRVAWVSNPGKPAHVSSVPVLTPAEWRRFSSVVLAMVEHHRDEGA